LTCKELVELVTDYFEGSLPRSERRRFERHLTGCDGCSVYLEQMRQTIELTGALRLVEIPLSLVRLVSQAYHRSRLRLQA
jgi:anti-sigma factor RsiW